MPYRLAREELDPNGLQLRVLEARDRRQMKPGWPKSAFVAVRRRRRAVVLEHCEFD